MAKKLHRFELAMLYNPRVVVEFNPFDGRYVESVKTFFNVWHLPLLREHSLPQSDVQRQLAAMLHEGNFRRSPSKEDLQEIEDFDNALYDLLCNSDELDDAKLARKAEVFIDDFLIVSRDHIQPMIQDFMRYIKENKVA